MLMSFRLRKGKRKRKHKSTKALMHQSSKDRRSKAEAQKQQSIKAITVGARRYCENFVKWILDFGNANLVKLLTANY